MEKKFESFPTSSRDELLKDALFALRETLQGEKLTSSVCTIAVLGVGVPYHVLDKETVQTLINEFEVVNEDPIAEEPEQGGDAQAQPEAPADGGAAPMDI